MATQFARGFSLPPEGTTADRIITVCGWCVELNILKLPRKPTDLVMIMWQDREVRAYKNGEPMYASHGVCPEHRKQLLDSANVTEKPPAEHPEWHADGWTGKR